MQPHSAELGDGHGPSSTEKIHSRGHGLTHTHAICRGFRLVAVGSRGTPFVSKHFGGRKRLDKTGRLIANSQT